MKNVFNHMIFIFEQILLFFFHLFYLPASVFSKNLKLQKFNERSLPELAQGSWVFFCSSAGEYRQAEALAKELKTKSPNCPIHYFIFSISGKNYIESLEAEPVGTYSLTPLIGFWAWQKYFRQLTPRGVFFIRGELWPAAVAASGSVCENYLVNFHQPRSLFLLPFFRWIFSHFDKVFTVSTVDKALRTFVVENTGDTKFDSFGSVNPAEPNFICLGSVWKEDLELLFDIKGLKPTHPIVVFPHNLSVENLDLIESTLSRTGIGVKKVKGLPEINPETNKGIYLCTELGVLRSAYQYAAKAYVGGGLRGALHNVLEPLAFGVPTYIGPHFQNSPDAAVMLKTDALSIVDSERDCLEFFNKNREISTKEYQVLFAKQKGASKKIISAVLGERLA